MATTPPAQPTRSAPAPSVSRQSRRRRWPSLLIFGCLGVLLLCLLSSALSAPLIVGMVGRTSPVNSRDTTSVAQGDTQRAAKVATHFLDNLAHRAYDQAYSDLDSSLLIGLSQSDFLQSAQTVDRCYGTITSYQEVSSSTASNGQLTLTYQVSRKLLPHSYPLTVTLQPDANGAWYITNYGNGSSQELDLTPGQHACTASYSQIWITATMRYQPLSASGEASTASGSVGRPKQGKEDGHAL